MEDNAEVINNNVYETEGPRRLHPRPEKAQTEDEEEEEEEEEEKELTSAEVNSRKAVIIRRIIAVSASFIFLIAAMQGLAVLQSSLNQEVGVWGLCANFAAVVVSCLFFSTFLVQRLGCKWAMVLGMACMMTWMLANLYPTWGTIIPGSLIMGAGWAPLWTAQCTFFTISGIELAELTKQMPDQIIARGFGFFFMAFMTGPIWGNLISSSILGQADQSPPPVNSSIETSFNFTNPLSTVASFDANPAPVLVCGAGFCPQVLKSLNGTAIQKPPQKLISILVGVYLGLSCIAILIVVVFVPNIKAGDDPKNKGQKVNAKAKFSLKLCAQTLKQLTNKLQLCMVPLNFYIGMEEGFTMVEFTMAFVTCSMGVSLIGYVTISYALTAAIISFTSGHMIRLIGRPPVFIFAFLSHIGCNIAWMLWTPGTGGTWIFFVFVAVWGIGDAIMQTQTNAFYGLLFSDNSEAAFSNYRMWEAFGIIVSLSYSSYLCVSVKLYIMMAVLIIGMVGYFATEIIHRKQKKDEEEEADEMDREEELALEEAKQKKTEDDDMSRSDSSVFHDYANLVRRKSNVLIPNKAVNAAAKLMRQNSIEDDVRPGVTQRKLSTFAPQMDAQLKALPKRKTSETIADRRTNQQKPRRTTVHDFPDPQGLQAPPQKKLEQISEL